MQTLHYYRVLRWHAAAERLGAVRGRNSGGVEQIFRAPRNAVERSSVVSRGNFFVCLFRLCKGEFARESNYAMQFGIELFQPLQINAGKPVGSEFALLDPTRNPRTGNEGDVFVRCQ